VVRALENPKWDWRTIDGISEETGIDPHQVALILTFLPNIVDIVQSSVPDKQGRPLQKQLLEAEDAFREATRENL